ALVGVRRRRGRRELLQGGLQRGEEDLGEAGEVAVEVALRGARATGDVGDARPDVAAVAEAVRGRRYELLSGLLAAFVGPLLRALRQQARDQLPDVPARGLVLPRGVGRRRAVRAPLPARLHHHVLLRQCL